MITKYNVQHNIDTLKASMKLNKEKTGKYRSSDATKLQFYLVMMAYLETNPTEQYLIDQRKSLNEKIKTIQSQYTVWVESPDSPKGTDYTTSKLKSIYSTLTGIKKYKIQLKTINFLLDDIVKEEKQKKQSKPRVKKKNLSL